MSLPLLPTLEDVRNSIATRVGLRNSGTLPQKQQALLDEEIRSAQRELFVSFHWLRRNVSIRVALSAGVSVYDVPNVLNLNGIHRIGVLESDGAKVSQLRYDDLQDIANAYTTPGKPRFWKIMGAQVAASPTTSLPTSESIVLTPAPASEWTTLVIEGQMRDYPPEEDDDRLVVDGEAVIRAVVIRMKEYLGIGGNQDRARNDLSAYILSLRGVEAPTHSYSIASRQADGPAYWTRPSTAAGYTPYSVEWAPW